MKASIFILKCFIRCRGKTLYLLYIHKTHVYTDQCTHTHPVHLPIIKAETPSNKTSKYVGI